jgi:rhodanese-related sulfurtransferase
MIIDLRSPQDFADGHAPGAINIPFGPYFLYYQNLLVPDSTDIHYIVPRMEMGPYLKHPFSLPDDVSEKLRFEEYDETYFLLDVRNPTEWEAKKHPKAGCIPLPLLPAHLADLPKDKPIACMCASGNRSSIAASYLLTQGFKDVMNVKGGINEMSC